MRKWEGFLKGVNLGGWISQFAEYSDEHFSTFIQEQDIANIAKMGFDHVRVPVDYNVLETEDGEIIEKGYSYIDHCIEWCHAHKLNVLIDVHEVFGYSFDPLKKDMDREKFFYDEALQARFFKLWEVIAARYAKYSDTVAFELLNEVVIEDVYQAWNKVAKEAVQHIRAIAPDTFIVIGGVKYNNVTSIKLLDAPYDDKIIYNFHCYEPLIFTHQKAYWIDGMPADFEIGYPDSLEHYREESAAYPKDCMGAIFEDNIKEIGPGFFEALFKTAIDAAEKFNVPLYCGEYGVIELAPKEDTKRWLADIHQVLEKYGIGRSIWNYKGKDFGIIDSDYGFM